jgi:hypothetical protein
VSVAPTRDAKWRRTQDADQPDRPGEQSLNLENEAAIETKVASKKEDVHALATSNRWSISSTRIRYQANWNANALSAVLGWIPIRFRRTYPKSAFRAAHHGRPSSNDATIVVQLLWAIFVQIDREVSGLNRIPACATFQRSGRPN